MYLDPKPYGDMVNQYVVGVDAMGLGGVTGKNHSLNRRVLVYLLIWLIVLSVVGS